MVAVVLEILTSLRKEGLVMNNMKVPRLYCSMKFNYPLLAAKRVITHYWVLQMACAYTSQISALVLVMTRYMTAANSGCSLWLVKRIENLCKRSAADNLLLAAWFVCRMNWLCPTRSRGFSNRKWSGDGLWFFIRRAPEHRNNCYIQPAKSKNGWQVGSFNKSVSTDVLSTWLFIRRR